MRSCLSRTMKRSLYLLVLLMAGLNFGYAIQAQDSVRVLTLDEFLDIVETHHPASVQADLRLDQGGAAVLTARGGFEPKVYTDYARKYFKEQEYYRLIDAGLKIPTWFGLELKAGFEQNQGLFVNPMDNTPNGGLWYAGVTLPVGQGLFIDERRAELRKARLFRNMTEAERQIILNDLLLDAGQAYWNWAFAHYSRQVFEEAVRIAEIRYEAVKQGARLGDLAPIDTLEAGIQLQNRSLNLQQAELDLANAEAFLSIFLWAEGMVPLELGENTQPVVLRASIDRVVADSLMELPENELLNVHPELQVTQFKLDQLRVDRRLKVEQFKPRLDLSFNPLVEATGDVPIDGFSADNYKLGVNFSMPILFRKERGGLRMADVKIQDAEMGLLNKRQQLNFKFRNALNELQTTFGQIQLYTQTVNDYEGLLEGERKKFNAGESSLFLVNSRESSFINAQVKLIELQTKNRKAVLKSIHSLGRLSDPEFRFF